MIRDHDELSDFRDAYLDYLEGIRDEPPTLDRLTADQRKTAEAFVESITASRGVDPYASRPSIEQLLARLDDASYTVDDIGGLLQAWLRAEVDPRAAVISDLAAEAFGVASKLLIQARGMRLRAVVEAPSVDLDAGFSRRVAEIASVFGAFPDTNSVLYFTTGPDPCGVIVEREDVHGAFETPSGAHRDPRLRSPVTDVGVACAQWLTNAIPVFDPPAGDLLEPMVSASPRVEPMRVASEAVADVVAAGGRARIKAKRASWTGLGEQEAAGLAAIIEEAQRGTLSEGDYRRRLANIVGQAA